MIQKENIEMMNNKIFVLCKCGKEYQYKYKNEPKTLLRHSYDQCVIYKATIAALTAAATNDYRS